MIRSVVLAFFAIIITGCMANHTERMQDIDPMGWRAGEVVTLSYYNRDTVSNQRISLLLRWDDTFNQPILPCTVITEAPDSTMFDEQINFQLKNGTVSKHSTGYRDSEIGYRDAVRLSQIGEYKFTISPAATNDPIVGIWAAGINISKN